MRQIQFRFELCEFPCGFYCLRSAIKIIVYASKAKVSNTYGRPSLRDLLVYLSRPGVIAIDIVRVAKRPQINYVVLNTGVQTFEKLQGIARPLIENVDACEL